MQATSERSFNNKPQGQILIAVLLIVVVATAIAITVASRSLTEQQVSTTVDESTRALNAAEAGVEDAYRQIASGTITSSGTISTPRLGGQASANYSIASFGGDTKDFISPNSVAQGESFQVILSATSGNSIDCTTGNYPLSSNNIRIAFGNGTNKFDAGTPALAVTMVYLNGGSYFNKRYVLEPYAGASRFFQSPKRLRTPLSPASAAFSASQ